jgi:arylsulfatase
MAGALSNYRTPGDVYCEGQKFQRPDNFHFTDGVTDYAVNFIKNQSAEKPFFLYVAHTAPHWSFKGLIGEALPEDAAPFIDTYNVGYDAIRQKRYEALIAKDLIKKEWKMAPNDADAWDSLDASKKAETAEEMANHAGLIVQMDRGIGKILKTLDEKGMADNTLVMFLSDNGASPEGRGFGPGWANTSCTPFKKYKLHLHEGGICTPLCARWPKIIPAGKQTDRAGHLVDIMATCVEIAGAQYPSSFKGKSIPPCQGKSLTSAFQGLPDAGHDYICWEYEGKMAVRQGKWKAIGKGTSWKELYDLEADRCEANNLAGSNSQKLNELKALYSKWWNNEWIIYEQATANGPSLPIESPYSLQRLSPSVYKAFGNRITLPDNIVRATRWIDIFDSRGKYCHTIACKGRRCIRLGKEINASHGFWIITCR